MKKGLEQQSLAVKSGVYPLYRYNPLLVEQGKNPLTLDYKQPSIPVKDYAYNETRYRMLVQSNENPGRDINETCPTRRRRPLDSL